MAFPDDPRGAETPSGETAPNLHDDLPPVYGEPSHEETPHHEVAALDVSGEVMTEAVRALASLVALAAPKFGAFELSLPGGARTSATKQPGERARLHRGKILWSNRSS